MCNDLKVLLLLNVLISSEHKKEQLEEIYKWKDFMLNEFEKKKPEGIKTSISTIIVQCTNEYRMPNDQDEMLLLYGDGYIIEKVGNLS